MGFGRMDRSNSAQESAQESVADGNSVAYVHAVYSESGIHEAHHQASSHGDTPPWDPQIDRVSSELGAEEQQNPLHCMPKVVIIVEPEAQSLLGGNAAACSQSWHVGGQHQHSGKEQDVSSSGSGLHQHTGKEQDVSSARSSSSQTRPISACRFAPGICLS